MSAQDEIKQRLEVAQLYEEMGQLPKATRYYIAAAEIALKGKLFDKGRELLHKALQLDPDNAQAKTYLDKLDKHLASQGDQAAIIWERDEPGQHQTVSYRYCIPLESPENKSPCPVIIYWTT